MPRAGTDSGIPVVAAGSWLHRAGALCGAGRPRLGQMAAFPHNAAPLMRILKVKVKPGARTESLTQQADGSWLASVKAPPVDGKANAAVMSLIAAHFGLLDGTALHCWFPVYDVEFARLSPGRLLLARMIDAAADRGIVRIERGVGTATAKTDFANEEVAFGRGLLLADGLRGAAIRGALAARWRGEALASWARRRARPRPRHDKAANRAEAGSGITLTASHITAYDRCETNVLFVVSWLTV